MVAGRPPRDLHGRCLQPLEVLLIGYPDPAQVSLGLDRERSIGGVFRVPCRNCEQCLLSRRNLWATRARVEYALAVRSWFITLTFGPDERSRLLWQARKSSTVNGDDFDALPPEKKFAAIEPLAGRHLTLWLKRVRKNSGARLRYFAAAEPHKDGHPHYHVLLHECGGVVTKRQLQSAWPLGFSNCKLSDTESSVWYVAKYLAKYKHARDRASARYGQDGIHALERVNRAIGELVEGILPNRL